MEILKMFLPTLIFVILLAIQYFLSRTGNKILGLIVPIVSIIGVGYLYFADKIGLGLIPTIILTCIGLMFLYGQWDSAQKDKSTCNNKDTSNLE